MDLGLSGARVLVTASTKGLGRGVLDRFCAEGARTFCCARTESDVAATISHLRGSGASIEGMTCDVSDRQGIMELAGEVKSRLGGLDVLVVNAGGPPPGRWSELTEEGWKSAVDITLMSAYRLISACEPMLAESTMGSVVLISSTSVKEPIDTLVFSNSIRLAVQGMAKSASKALAPRVRVNVVLPGRFLTARTAERAGNYPGGVEKFVEHESSMIPLGRFGELEELANAVVFLASPRASYVTGATLAVDGGVIGTPV